MAIVAERSLEAVLAQLAVLTAGAFFVPLHIRACRPPAGTSSCATSPAPPADRRPGHRGIGRDRSAAAGARRPARGRPGRAAAAPGAAQPTPTELAYAIYTSGSTGTPKAVGGLHGAAEALLADYDARLPIAPGARCAWTASPHFDVSIGEVFGALGRGGTLVIAGDAAAGGAAPYAAWLADQRVAIAEMPAPYLAELLALVRAGRAAGLQLAAMTVGTEPIPHPLLAELRRALPRTRILNFYGPSETTVECTVFEVGPEADPATLRPVKTPIGRPLASVRTYVVDRRGELAPPGVIGELWIGGAFLTRGYRRPGLTAEKFVPDRLRRRRTRVFSSSARWGTGIWAIATRWSASQAA